MSRTVWQAEVRDGAAWRARWWAARGEVRAAARARVQASSRVAAAGAKERQRMVGKEMRARERVDVEKGAMISAPVSFVPREKKKLCDAKH